MFNCYVAFVYLFILIRNSKIMSEKGEDDSLQSREDTDKSTSTEEEIINQMDEVEQANANK